VRDIYDGRDEFIALKTPADDATWLHECEDGHHWQEHANGSVSPSYGYGGTELAWAGYDSKTCPEPARPGPGHGIKCPTCGTFFYCGHCPGPDDEVSIWNEPECAPPSPACLKPIVWSARWTPVKQLLHREGRSGISERYEGWTATWVPVDLETGFSKAQNVREPALF
jgi:hypothetical protein